MKRDNIKSINIIKGLAAVLIVMMHIRFNTDIEYNGYFFENLVPMFGNLVFLFMIISGFGMFNGYYERFKNKEIDLNEFYLRRIKKIAPFFILLIIVDIIANRTLTSVVEGFMNSTFMFGLLPYNDLNSIGVAWTLGIIFIFYFLFPFFVFLLYNKRRAWVAFAASIIINFICNEHFFVYPFVVEGHFSPRKNFLYCMCFFILGGILYLYKDKLLKLKEKKHTDLFARIGLLAIIGIYIIWPDSLFAENNYVFILKSLVLMGGICACAILLKKSWLDNKLTNTLARYSMELYLSHMFIFRVLEKASVLGIIQNNVPNQYATFAIITVLTIALSVLFSYIFNVIFDKITKHPDNKEGAKRRKQLARR